MDGHNQITGNLFVSVDEACLVLDELTLPECYVTTIKRQHRVGKRKDSEVKLLKSAVLRKRCPQQAIYKD